MLLLPWHILDALTAGLNVTLPPGTVDVWGEPGTTGDPWTDLVGVYAGLRPLLTGESDDTSMLSREHAVIVSDTGLISVAGGKYTT